MATFRVGIGSFNINDGAVGIGTEGAGHGNLKVEGVIKSTNLDVLGVSTFTRYSGFNADEVNVNNRDLTLSGEYSTTGDIVVEDSASLTVGLGSTACVASVECISVKHHFSVPVGDTAQRNETSGYAEGTVRYNRDLGTMEFFNGNEWRQFTYIVDVQNSPSSRGRVVTATGQSPTTDTTSIEFTQIHSDGKSFDFGEMTRSDPYRSGNSNETRALFSGGYVSPAEPAVNTIDYITIASAGDAIDFGDLVTKTGIQGYCSSSTRGFSAGGWVNPSPANDTNVIQYNQFSTLGNSLDFGDLTATRRSLGGTQSPTRGIFAGGETNTPNTYKSEIQMITMASLGNSVRFGDLISEKRYDMFGNVCNHVRGVFGGFGYSGASVSSSSIEYITTASEGNAVFFGDLSTVKNGNSGASSLTRGLFTGGQDPAHSNTIEFITIATTGDGTDFGDMTMKRRYHSSISDSHGGLGGY